MDEDKQVDYYSPESGIGEEAASFHAPQHNKEILGSNGQLHETQVENPTQQINDAQHENRNRVGGKIKQFITRHPAIASGIVFIAGKGLETALELIGMAPQHFDSSSVGSLLTAVPTTATYMEAKFPGVIRSVGSELKNGMSNLHQKISQKAEISSSGK